ncbi:MAG: ABC transporter substrate-binding protein [Thermomicrobiales bacterium]
MQRWLLSIGSILCFALVSLAACTGDDDDDDADDPTATSAAPTATIEATPAASPLASPAASPVAAPVSSPIASPATASPVAVTSTDQSMTREEFQRQLLQRYPMEPAAREGGRVLLGEASDISTVNGILTNDTLTFAVTGAIYEALIGASPIDGRPVPGLADSWEVSADGLVYTFHLNQDATWHDGTDLTAEDVKFSFDAVLDPNTGSSYTTQVNDAVASYRVVNPDTFEIIARDRLVNFLYDGPGAVLVMPRHVWQDIGFESWSFDPGSTGQDPSRVVGTGPFKLKEWVQGDHVTLTRNDDYYDVVPHIEEFVLQIQPNADTAVLALEDGATDIMEIIPPAQMESVQGNPNLNVEIYNFYQFTYYAFNLDAEVTPLFQDKEVRQALFTALDRDAITESIFLGYGEAAVGTQPRLSPAYAPEQMTPSYEYDPEQAKLLLEQAGWSDSNDNGTVDKDGVELEFTLVAGDGDAVTKQIISYMQEAWDQIGVELEADFVAFPILVDRLEAHDFEMTLLAVNLTPDGSQGPIFSCDAYRNGLNFMNYCNPVWDALDEQQKRQFDPARRVDLLVQQSQIVWEDQPVGVIRFGVARTGYNTRLHNFYPNGYGFLWSLPYVWVEE